MVRLDSLLGYSYYYRVTADGRIQRSDDGKTWTVPRNWRGKRVNMAGHTVAEVEAKIARQLDDPDRNFGAYIVAQGG